MIRFRILRPGSVQVLDFEFSIATAQSRRFFYFVIIAVLVALCSAAEAQEPKQVPRIGVITSGGTWYATIDGLRAGLRQLGLEEGRQFVLAIKETKGDAKAAEDAARILEQERVDLIYTTQTSVTIPARRGTTNIPIVFCIGADPVAVGLVDSLAKPGGRLTGVHYRDTDLTAKRLELLKEIVPKMRRVITFYDPRNPVALGSLRVGRETASLLGVEFVERHVSSIEELQAGMRALRTGEVDAFFEVSDAMVNSQDQMIIDTARVKRLLTMFINQGSVKKGGFASYGPSYGEVGRLSARYVQRILSGAKPNDLPVEGVDKIEFIINLKTAKQIGLIIPPNVLARADRVIR